MAELEQAKTSECCSPAARETCCEPGAKGECCGDSASGTCGCSAAAEAGGEEIREAVSARRAAAATSVSEGASCCDSIIRAGKPA